VDTGTLLYWEVLPVDTGTLLYWDVLPVDTVTLLYWDVLPVDTVTLLYWDVLPVDTVTLLYSVRPCTVNMFRLTALVGSSDASSESCYFGTYFELRALDVS
jgi:hypothetical protein